MMGPGNRVESWLAQIGPLARVLSVEDMIVEFGDGDRDFTLRPKCSFCGDDYCVASQDPGELPHSGPSVAYQFLLIRFDAPGYERGEALSETGTECPGCNSCKQDALDRLMKDRLAIAEEAIRAIPVANATVSGRALALQAVSELREAV